jgi:hypothetical protein
MRVSDANIATRAYRDGFIDRTSLSAKTNPMAR